MGFNPSEEVAVLCEFFNISCSNLCRSSRMVPFNSVICCLYSSSFCAHVSLESCSAVFRRCRRGKGTLGVLDQLSDGSLLSRLLFRRDDNDGRVEEPSSTSLSESRLMYLDLGLEALCLASYS